MKSLLHLARFALGIDPASSQVSGRELAMILRYSRDARVICEIGCYEGQTSVALALNTTGTVYSIDPFFPGRLGICYTEWVARIHRWRQNVQNLVFLKGLSVEIGPKFDLPIDFLFIDADHSYDAVKADWKEWVPKLRRNGFVALHDAKPAANSPQALGSMKFYLEDLPHIAEVSERDSVDSLVIVQRR